jgi:hypothetical protein
MFLLPHSPRAQTVAELKELCTRFQVPKTGKKQDLIDSLARHLGGVFDGGGGAGVRGDDEGGGNAEGGGADSNTDR